jgi:hypothetical protein
VETAPAAGFHTAVIAAPGDQVNDLDFSAVPLIPPGHSFEDIDTTVWGGDVLDA